MSSPALVESRPAYADYVELTKPRITTMVVFTALVGFVCGTVGAVSVPALLAVLVGTGFVASGASVLNMLLERDTDALMRRTRNRPLPAGRLRATEALSFGLALSAGLLLESGFQVQAAFVQLGLFLDHVAIAWR
jgi:protoheme IX farnesyltransferase